VPIIVGVDGGNSKTLTVVANELGHVLGVGRGAGGNHQNRGMDGAMHEIKRSITAALATADIAPADVDAAFYALAGADLEEDFAILRPVIAGLDLGGRWEVENDTMAGWRAGASRADAVVVIVGSGTNAAGRNAAGEQIRLPGLGWISGDWGGGGELAREAVSAAMRAWDGRGEPTALSGFILRTLDRATIDDLILALYHEEIRGTQLLDIVPLIFEAAAAGDGVARRIVERQAEEIVTTAGTLLGRLGLDDVASDVVLAGSVFRERTGQLVHLVRSHLLERYPQARVIVSSLEPVLGAVLCGMDLLELDTGETVRRRLVESFAGFRAEGVQVALP
jgi:N-acetylglucosamine kinase-like BadF-type ATPase